MGVFCFQRHKSLKVIKLYLANPGEEKNFETGTYRKRKAWICLQWVFCLAQLGWGELAQGCWFRHGTVAKANSIGGSSVLAEAQERGLWELCISPGPWQLLWYLWTPFFFLVSTECHRTTNFSYVLKARELLKVANLWI